MTSRPPNLTTSPASENRPATSARTSAFLHVVASPDPERVGGRCPLGDDVLLLGRDLQTEGGLCLQDQRLSRVHARLAFDPRSGAYRVGDGQSRNGTFVNGKRITTALLAAGDVIRAGDTLLVYCEVDAMARMREQVQLLAARPLTVLVRGETGTGKELIARSLHQHSGRRGAFVPVNCASIPPELIAAEFFGHTRSAFSGATGARKGMFAAAEGGTLFLDEIGDCPLPVQAALLRALQEKAIRPLGAEHELPIDVRVIAATNADLELGMQSGSFRPDLYARLTQGTLRVPPLRERRSELLELIAELSAARAQPPSLTPDALEALLCWRWPFNVRELQALLETAVPAAPGKLGLDWLRAAAPELAQLVSERRAESAGEAGPSTPPAEPGAQRQRLSALLDQHGGNVSAVAKAIGKPRAQVYRWMKAFGLSATRFRK
jgi:transcriptional regulator with GAF, ATPase, and Fis domain